MLMQLMLSYYLGRAADFDALEVFGPDKLTAIKTWLLNPELLKDFLENETVYAGKYLQFGSVCYRQSFCTALAADKPRADGEREIFLFHCCLASVVPAPTVSGTSAAWQYLQAFPSKMCGI